MKKCLILLLLGLSLISQAQRFKGGVMLGLNASQIDGDEIKGYNKAGLTGGVYVFTEFAKKWSAQMELRYAAKGSSTAKDDQNKMKYKLQYMELPLSCKYKITPSWQGELGLSLGYLFKAKKFMYDGSDDQIITSDLTKLELAGFGGMTYTHLAPVFINVHFSYSLFSVYKPYTSPTTQYGAWYNNVITIAFYYQIGKK
jgi:hypothetical protein